MLELVQIGKNFNDGEKINKVLHDINLIINKNEYITIRGESGSGKSTLLNLMSLLLQPTKGSMRFLGENINYNKEKRLVNLRGENMGLIFQNSNLISCLNPLENIMLAMHSKLSTNTKERKAKELLDKVGLSDKYKSKTKSLSGGEAQRVAIVRALVNNPKLLFCDEPTGALDHDNSKNILTILENIQKETKCSLIIVTHDLNIWNKGRRKLLVESGQLYEMD